MPKTVEQRNVRMNQVLQNDLLTPKPDVVGTVGIPGPDNNYTFKVVHRRVRTAGEKIIFRSLSALGGLVTGVIAYSNFFR